MLPGLRTIVFPALLLPPVLFFQSGPQPGLLKVTSNSPGAKITISVVDQNGNVDKNSKQVEAMTNVSLVVTPGYYKVTATTGSTSLKCTPTPAEVKSGQTVPVACN